MLRSFQKLYTLNKCNVTTQRLKSAWIKASSTTSKGNIDVEALFIDDKVQSLLKALTGLDVEGKIFTERNIEKAERSHYALMTDSMLEEARAQMGERATSFLQFVPVKEPRPKTYSILAKDPEIEGFDNCKFVFTDITFDATNQDRTVVVREPDGVLRTALPEEHDRMNRVYYEEPNRPPFPPAVFKDPDLKNALDENRHEFVMDFACWFYEPDDPAFVELSHEIFDRIVADNKFDVLYSTRHFGALAFYLVLNNNIKPLLRFYETTGSVRDAANLIRLQKIVFPDWRTAISFEDTDEKILQDFKKQNKYLYADRDAESDRNDRPMYQRRPFRARKFDESDNAPMEQNDGSKDEGSAMNQRRPFRARKFDRNDSTSMDQKSDSKDENSVRPMDRRSNRKPRDRKPSNKDDKK